MPLEKELQQLKHLISLEQSDANEPVYIQLRIEGKADDKFIAPMVIVKLLEEVLTSLHTAEQESRLLDVHVIVSNVFLLTLSFTEDKESVSTKWPLLIKMHTSG